MFEVASKTTGTKKIVYAVRHNPDINELEFLVYEVGTWFWIRTREYIPTHNEKAVG